MVALGPVNGARARPAHRETGLGKRAGHALERAQAHGSVSHHTAPAHLVARRLELRLHEGEEAALRAQQAHHRRQHGQHGGKRHVADG